MNTGSFNINRHTHYSSFWNTSIISTFFLEDQILSQIATINWLIRQCSIQAGTSLDLRSIKFIVEELMNNLNFTVNRRDLLFYSNLR